MARSESPHLKLSSFVLTAQPCQRKHGFSLTERLFSQGKLMAKDDILLVFFQDFKHDTAIAI